MVNRPEDRGKVIGLSIGIGFVVLYFLMGILPRLMHENGQPTTVTETSQQSTAPIMPGPAVPAVSPVSVVSDINDMFQPTDTFQGAAHDPFKPPLGGPVVKPAVATTRPGVASPIINEGRPLPGPGSVPPMPLERLPPPVPKMPDIQLSGVIVGDPAVAVLRIDGQNCQKMVGEKLADGIILEKISEEGILLKQGKKSILLEVGHSFGNPTASGMASGSLSEPSSPPDPKSTPASDAVASVPTMTAPQPALTAPAPIRIASVHARHAAPDLKSSAPTVVIVAAHKASAPTRPAPATKSVPAVVLVSASENLPSVENPEDGLDSSDVAANANSAPSHIAPHRHYTGRHMGRPSGH